MDKKEIMCFQVRLPKEVHKNMKHYLVDKQESINAYINKLIKEDLQKRNISF